MIISKHESPLNSSILGLRALLMLVLVRWLKLAFIKAKLTPIISLSHPPFPGKKKPSHSLMNRYTGVVMGIWPFFDLQTKTIVSLCTYLALGFLEFVPLTKKMTTSTAVKMDITAIDTTTTTPICVCISVERNNSEIWQLDTAVKGFWALPLTSLTE